MKKPALIIFVLLLLVLAVLYFYHSSIHFKDLYQVLWPLFWPAHMKGATLFVLDETLVPSKIKYIPVKDVHGACGVIRGMKTRAFGQFLVVLNTFLLVLMNDKGRFPKILLNKLKKTADNLNNSRPTFPFSEVTSIVVGWAHKAVANRMDIRPFLNKNIQGYLMGIRVRRLDRVKRIAELIKDGDRILTHCNVSGELAMAANLCQKQNKKIHFFATETRPYLQGAKLTCWELKQMNAEVTLISDSTIGSVMADGLITKVIVGSDRNCANGDFANKIGTYSIAVLAKEFEIPFYVLTQPSQKIKSGDDIPIEFRSDQELLNFAGEKIAPKGAKGFYPGFDIVPNALITGSIAIDVN